MNGVPIVVSRWERSKQINRYYHHYLRRYTKHLIPSPASILEFGSRGGELLAFLPNKTKIGVEIDDRLLQLARKNRKAKFVKQLTQIDNTQFDYILVNHTLSITDDIQIFVKSLKRVSKKDAKILVYNFNYFWKPILSVVERLGLMMPWGKEPNWLSQTDIDNMFFLEGFERVKKGGLILIPFEITIVSNFINKYLAPLPILRYFCLSNFTIYRRPPNAKNYSVSIIIPARNESGHMRGVLKKIPKLGLSTEVIFVEGWSTDNTYEMIRNEIKGYKGPLKCTLYKQKGKGKGDAVRLGFEKAKNELVMILDADLTVSPKELTKFYDAVASGKTDFVMGSRLVYPMENEAMRSLNYLANHFFGIIFSFLLNQKIKDTLCGTKVISKDNYEKIALNRKVFGDFDPFGDFDLIFGAAKLNLKILEIPVRYRQRVYGTTNISRYRHGLLLLKMILVASKKIKFI